MYRDFCHTVPTAPEAAAWRREGARRVVRRAAATERRSGSRAVEPGFGPPAPRARSVFKPPEECRVDYLESQKAAWKWQVGLRRALD